MDADIGARLSRELAQQFRHAHFIRLGADQSDLGIFSRQLMQMLARAAPHFQPEFANGRWKLRACVFGGIENNLRQEGLMQLRLPRRQLRPFAPAIKLATLTLGIFGLCPSYPMHGPASPARAKRAGGGGARSWLSSQRRAEGAKNQIADLSFSARS